jgi:hypothetical protein
MFAPTTGQAAGNACATPLAHDIPPRSEAALPARAVIAQLDDSNGPSRDAALVDQLLAGNVPEFLRDLAPVTLTGTRGTGQPVSLTLCVTPDYMAVGNDRDFVRVALGYGAAAQVASELGFLLPTTRMVDAIFEQAAVRLPPRPMAPTAAMTTTRYLVDHNRTVERQMAEVDGPRGALRAGHKKDLVLSNRLRSKPGRVAIYGWHRPNGTPIQPLSTVHGGAYADYSHGLRLVGRVAFLDGQPVLLDQIIEDPELAGLVSDEGPIAGVSGLIDGYDRFATR